MESLCFLHLVVVRENGDTGNTEHGQTSWRGESERWTPSPGRGCRAGIEVVPFAPPEMYLQYGGHSPICLQPHSREKTGFMTQGGSSISVAPVGLWILRHFMVGLCPPVTSSGPRSAPLLVYLLPLGWVGVEMPTGSGLAVHLGW